MSKELEALDGIKKVLAKYISEKTGVSEEKHFEYLQYDTEIDLVTKALTPPTADEVCKALSQFDDFDKVEYDEQTKTFSSGEIICYIGYDFSSDKCKTTIIFNYDLPPHLITLIGRFYEAQDV